MRETSHWLVPAGPEQGFVQVKRFTRQDVLYPRIIYLAVHDKPPPTRENPTEEILKRKPPKDSMICMSMCGNRCREIVCPPPPQLPIKTPNPKNPPGPI